MTVDLNRALLCDCVTTEIKDNDTGRLNVYYAMQLYSYDDQKLIRVSISPECYKQFIEKIGQQVQLTCNLSQFDNRIRYRFDFDKHSIKFASVQK